jgi:hypothetical protein
MVFAIKENPLFNVLIVEQILLWVAYVVGFFESFVIDNRHQQPGLLRL